MKRHCKFFPYWISLSLLSLTLLACNKPEPVAQDDWVADEILQQLAELRKEVKSLKGDLAQLDARIGSAGAARLEGGPQQVQLSSDLVLGDADAKYAIVEFTDYQCPFCARHNRSVLPEIKEKLIDTGKAKYVMYDFPLGFHAQAKPAAVAARCAGEQGKYWEMHDAIFSNQSTLGLALYESAAKDLALDQASFASCLNAPEMIAKVESNVGYGSRIGVSGTPKFYVGKVKDDVMTDVIVISGAQAYSAFAGAVARLERKAVKSCEKRKTNCSPG